MSDHVDRILDLVDGALQSSSEDGYARDARGLCVRCQHHAPAGDGEMCAACRGFLLGDSDEDPLADPVVAQRHALDDLMARAERLGIDGDGSKARLAPWVTGEPGPFVVSAVPR